MEGEDFLKNKFANLHTSPEVKSSVRRNEKRENAVASQKPIERIRVYLDRFEEILERSDPKERERGVEAFKKILFDGNVIKESAIPNRVYELEQEVAFNLGHGTIEITDEYKQNKNREIIKGQKDSLSSWVEYLSSTNALYPMWAKYWVLKSVLEVGKYNKGKRAFDKRGKDSVAPFPPINIGALAKSVAIIQDKIKGQKIENFSNLEDDEFKKVLDKEDFAKYYALALESLPEFSEAGLENIQGEWVVYKQVPYQTSSEEYPEQYPSQVQKLFGSLQGYPLEWCTAQNIDTAYSQLKAGDFHVYYSENSTGQNKIPRVAIRMEGEKIAEVRGIEPKQEMDRFIMPVVEEKMGSFGQEGEKYKKKGEDMKRLTEIYNKSFGHKDPKTGEREFLSPKYSAEELEFIYQLNNPIDGFGYFYENRNNPYEVEDRLKEIIGSREKLFRSDVKTIFKTEIDEETYPSEKYEKYSYLEDMLAGRRAKHSDNTHVKNESNTDKIKAYKWGGLIETVSKENFRHVVEVLGELKMRTSLDDLREYLLKEGKDEYLVENVGDFYDSREKQKLFAKNLLRSGWDKEKDREHDLTEDKYARIVMDSLRDFSMPDKVKLLLENGGSVYLLENLDRYFDKQEYPEIIRQSLLSLRKSRGSIGGGYWSKNGNPFKIIIEIDESILSSADKEKIFASAGELDVVFSGNNWQEFSGEEENIINDEFMMIVEKSPLQYFREGWKLVDIISKNPKISISYNGLKSLMSLLARTNDQSYGRSEMKCLQIMFDRGYTIDTNATIMFLDTYLRKSSVTMHANKDRSSILQLIRGNINSFEEPQKIQELLKKYELRKPS